MLCHRLYARRLRHGGLLLLQPAALTGRDAEGAGWPALAARAGVGAGRPLAKQGGLRGVRLRATSAPMMDWLWEGRLLVWLSSATLLSLLIMAGAWSSPLDRQRPPSDGERVAAVLELRGVMPEILLADTTPNEDSRQWAAHVAEVAEGFAARGGPDAGRWQTVEAAAGRLSSAASAAEHVAARRLLFATLDRLASDGLVEGGPLPAPAVPEEPSPAWPPQPQLDRPGPLQREHLDWFMSGQGAGGADMPLWLRLPAPGGMQDTTAGGTR